MKLIVTIDTEEDSGPDWVSPAIPSFRGVTEGLKNRLQPIFSELGILPTLMCSPIVLQSIEAVDVLGNLEKIELAAHLHWEQIGPKQERSLRGGQQLLRHMQTDFSPDEEREKLEALTSLFHQQFGFLPTSFRAGRYGISRATGGILKQLGYEVDTSATPHVHWRSPSGNVVDYSRTLEQPYTISESGNIFERGNLDFLEVPITILPHGQIVGLTQAPWLRPNYSNRETMKEMVRIIRERNIAGIEQPLVMMFHNVEVIANASPYTKTEEDVRAYLDDMRAVLEYATEMGFEPSTLTDYARSFKQAQLKAQQRQATYQINITQDENIADNGIGIPAREVRRAVHRHNVPPWHLYIYRERNTRWDVVSISDWVNKNIPRSGAILSAGCGMAFNLYWWARQGYTDLHGFDSDKNTIAASQELAALHNLPIKLWVGRLQNGNDDSINRFDYIDAMNCLMYEDGIYPRFFKAYAKALKPNGYLAVDTIDASYSLLPNSPWLTSDMSKPVEDRAPSEYKVRLTEKQVVDMASQHGLALVEILKDPSQTLPRFIYIFRKAFLAEDTTKQEKPAELHPALINRTPSSVESRKARVLFCVDAPGWAHDFKTTNLIKNLSHRFECRKVYDQQVSRDDIAWAEVIIIYYWPQFRTLIQYQDLLPAKIVLGGISSPTDIEGDQRLEMGMRVFSFVQGVFVHNQLLYKDFKAVFANKPFYLNPNGVDTHFYCPASPPKPSGKPLIVGWAGSLENHGSLRGYHDIIVPAVKMTEGIELRTAAREDKLRGPDEMLEFYRTLDVYLVGSRVEGTPNPGLESAACGIPVISTRVGNMPELIRDGENGFLVDERTPEAFSEKMAILRDNPFLLQKMRTQIRQDIADWDWEIKAENYGMMIADSLARYGWKPN